jgi:phage-related protein
LKYREVCFYENYFLSFYDRQSTKVKRKIDAVIEIVQQEKIIPVKFFKHLSGTNGLYEIRVEYNNDIFRIFSFFEKNRLIILVNGFQKKKQKTPKREIRKALRIKKEYENEKSSS